MKNKKVNDLMENAFQNRKLFEYEKSNKNV